jgi:hypothetical protein
MIIEDVLITCKNLPCFLLVSLPRCLRPHLTCPHRTDELDSYAFARTSFSNGDSCFYDLFCVA